MARYEEARIRYQKTVLGSLQGASNGEAIRHAILAFQAASADLKRLTGDASASPAPAKAAANESVIPGLSFVMRLLRAT
jgi:hypothetical protein